MKQTQKKTLSKKITNTPIVQVSHHHHHTSIQDIHWESFGYGAFSIFGIIAVFFFLAQGVTGDVLKGSLDQAQNQKIDRIEKQLAAPVEQLITPESIVGDESEYTFILDNDGAIEKIVPINSAMKDGRVLKSDSVNDSNGQVLGTSDQKEEIHSSGGTTQMNLMIR